MQSSSSEQIQANTYTSIAILIPCLNESLTISKVIEDFKKNLPEANIYVYDNNSNDNSSYIAKKAGAIVHHEKKRGKGNVVRTMFREINADCYLLVDGDDTYPAKFAYDMIAPIINGQADMVIGDRLSSTYYPLGNKTVFRIFHSFGNKFVCNLVNLLFKGTVSDVMTGYRAFSYLFVKTFPVLSKEFEIETEMTIHALDKNLHVVSLPITYHERPSGSSSKLRTFSDGFKILKTIFCLYKQYRPFAFFSIIALILMALAISLFIPILKDYHMIRLIHSSPTLIFICFLIFSAIQFFICGLILNSEAKKALRDFEIYMNLIQSFQNSSFDSSL